MQIVCQTHGVGESEIICSKCVELVEQKINSLQQLQAKIADLIEWYDIPISMGLRAVNRAQLVAKLQQLSAVQ